MRRFLRALAFVLLPMACSGETDGSEGRGRDRRLDGASGPSSDELDKESATTFSNAAHARALDRLVPLATKVFSVHDPVAAARAGQGDLRPPSLGIAARSVTRDLLRLALREAGGIDETHLVPDRVVILRAIRFGLNRINDEIERQPWMRNDPTVFYARTEDFLDEVEYRMTTGSCSLCDAELDALQIVLNHRSEYSSTSMAGLGAAIDLHSHLIHRLENLASHAPSPLRAAINDQTSKLIKKLENRGARLRSLADTRLSEASEHTWTAPPRPRVVDPQKTWRLPDRLGSRTLIRRLGVEHSITATPHSLLAGVQKNLGRLANMGRGLPSLEHQHRSPSIGQCEQILSPMKDWLRRHPNFDSADLPCATLVDAVTDRSLSDASFRLAILDLQIIEPMRRTVRRKAFPPLAILRGQGSRRAHLRLREIMLLFAGYGAPTTTRQALHDAREDLCLAGTALWVHGDLGDSEANKTWHALHCTEFSFEHQQTQALGNPRLALQGLGLAILSDTPRDFIGLDRFYWAPVGIMPLLATPSGQYPDVSSSTAPGPRLRATIEEFYGETP